MRGFQTYLVAFLLGVVSVILPLGPLAAQVSDSSDPGPGEPFIAIMGMDMMILPGTLGHLEQSIKEAHAEGAKALIILLDTPGGILQTSQEMIQVIFRSPIPVVVYVAPAGSTATSAGVFITLAGHIAAMAPGTSIGAATPVMGDGQDLAKDMKAKAENITAAMVRSIAERRGRNMAWAEKAVKEAASITETEAQKLGVVDFVAEDIGQLLRMMKGKEVRMDSGVLVLDDWSKLPRRTLEISSFHAALNVLSHPNVIALLWLAATTGISIELYNPGLIFPGVIGVMCLILALAVSQIIPINSAAIMLFAFGAILIGAELMTGTLILGIMGVVSLILGALYLFDPSAAPGLSVSYEFIVPVAAAFGAFMMLVAVTAYRTIRRPVATGQEGMIGRIGTAAENISLHGRIFVNGEYWNATTSEGLIEEGAPVEVVGVKDHLVLEVRRRR